MRFKMFLLSVFVLGTCLGQKSGVALQEPGPIVEKRQMLAERFHFTPGKIQMKLGTSLRLVLSSRDTFHGFHLLGTDINVEIPARGKGKVEVLFTPEKEGVYPFVCSKRCGAGHTDMRGEIVVKPR